MTDEQRRAGRDALRAYLIAAVLVAVFVQIHVTLPWVGELGSALVAVVFLFVPQYITWRRDEDLEAYGFHTREWRRALPWVALAYLLVFPLFAGGYYAFWEVGCHSSLRQLMEGECGAYLNHGFSHLHWPVFTLFENDRHTTMSLEFCLVQYVVVALPEELFFRGVLLGLLEKRFPPKRTLWGGKIGLALVLSSLAFCLVHIPKGGDVRQVVTFFPGMLFGWLRSRTGSIFAGTLVHGGSNVLVKALELTTMR